jgi:hypothetical protein
MKETSTGTLWCTVADEDYLVNNQQRKQMASPQFVGEKAVPRPKFWIEKDNVQQCGGSASRFFPLPAARLQREEWREAHFPVHVSMWH